MDASGVQSRYLDASGLLGRQQADDMSQAYASGFRSQREMGGSGKSDPVQVNITMEPVMSDQFVQFIERKRSVTSKRGLT